MIGIVIRTFWQQTELPKLYCVSVATNMLRQSNDLSKKRRMTGSPWPVSLLNSDAVDPRIRHCVPPVLCRLAGLQLGAKTSEIEFWFALG